MTKTKKRKLAIGLIIGIPAAIIIIAIALIIKFGPMFGFWLVPPSAESYGKTALETIQKNGIYASSDEWSKAYADALNEIKTASNYEDTYAAIQKALAAGGGKHSMLLSKSEASQTQQSYDEILPSVRMDGEIAVIKLPDFLGTAEAGKRDTPPWSRSLCTQIRTKSRALCLTCVTTRAATWGRWRVPFLPCCPRANLFITITAATIYP